MAAEIKYKCDFCQREVITKSINPECQAFVKIPNVSLGRQKFTNDLSINLKGKCICRMCVDEIIQGEYNCY